MWRQHGNALLQSSSSSPSAEIPQSRMVRPAPTTTMASTSWWAQQKYAAPATQGGMLRSALQPFQPLSSLYVSSEAPTTSADARRPAPAAAPSAVSSANTSSLSLGHLPLHPHQAPSASTTATRHVVDLYPGPPAVPSAASPASHNTSHLVHSRFLPSSSADEPAERERGIHTSHSAAEGMAAVLQDRVASTMAVNLSLQQELDAAKHEASRLRVDNSRLRDHVSALQAQDQFLKSQLESVVSRQQELLSFEHSAEGQGRRDVLEQQNHELRQVVQFKEDELRAMQQRLQEVCRRVAQLEASTHVARPLPTMVGTTVAPNPSSVSSEAVTAANRKQTLCSALEFAQFVLRGLRSARHVLCAPHRCVGLSEQQREEDRTGAPVSGDAIATCGLTQRACAMRCLSHVTKGACDDPTVLLQCQSKTVDELLYELHETVVAQHSALVNTSNEIAQRLLSSEFDVMMSGGTDDGEGRTLSQLVTSRPQPFDTESRTAPLRSASQQDEPALRVQNRSGSGSAAGAAVDDGVSRSRVGRRNGWVNQSSKGRDQLSLDDTAVDDDGLLTGARSTSPNSSMAPPPRGAATTTTTTTHELHLPNGERRSVMVERQSSPTGSTGMPRTALQQGDATPAGTNGSRQPPTLYPPRRSAPSASTLGAQHNHRNNSGCEHQ